MDTRSLTHGVDTLVLWYSWGSRYRLPQNFLSRLETARQERANLDLVHPILVNVADLTLPATLEGRTFERAQFRRVRHYRYGLTFGNEALFIGFSDPSNAKVMRDDYAQVRVELHGRYIRALGGDIREIVDIITARLISLVAEAGVSQPDPLAVRVTRVDLYADFVSPSEPFSLADLHRFVSRARDRQAYLEAAEQAPGGERVSAAPGAGGPLKSSTGAAKCNTDFPYLIGVPAALSEAQVNLSGPRWTSFRFGSSKLLARLYSKTAEARKKPDTKELLRDYAAEFSLDEDATVWRVEFQLRKDVLAAFLHPELGVLDLRNWSVLVEHLGALWHYLTTEWLSLRTPTANKQPTRWPEDPLWNEVVLAWARIQVPLKRARRPLRASAEGLVSQAVGVILSAAAVQGVALERVAQARRSLERTLSRLLGSSPFVLPESLSGGVFELRYLERLALYQGVTS
ncbi:MAG: hypothetical protein GXN93_01065 [Candidatus Diapherotrites archaeon]|nr:hypothetical protein [Candidatus Diapherotrites archaeon]